MKPLSKDDVRNMCGCPRCGAAAGQACFQKGKKGRRKANHQARLQKAQSLAGHNVRPKPPATKAPVKQKRIPSKKPADAFYASWEWKKVRYEALIMHGRQCMVCGFTPYPGCKEHLVVDHIKPRSRFPELELSLSNLQVVCNSCNMGKSNVYQHDFRAEWHGDEEGPEDDPLTAQFRATMQ